MEHFNSQVTIFYHLEEVEGLSWGPQRLPVGGERFGESLLSMVFLFNFAQFLTVGNKLLYLMKLVSCEDLLFWIFPLLSLSYWMPCKQDPSKVAQMYSEAEADIVLCQLFLIVHPLEIGSSGVLLDVMGSWRKSPLLSRCHFCFIYCKNWTPFEFT